MKADFSRGFNPDRKRGMEYRRVLLQQGRVLLDSDVAAMVDANDQLLRLQCQDLGTDAGGRERAFMITAGRLYATFRELTKVRDPDVGLALRRRIDYATRFRTRLPTLLVDSPQAGSGSLVIDLFSSHERNGNLVLWLRSDEEATAPRDEDGDFITGLTGGTYSGSLVGLSTTEFRRFEFEPDEDGPDSDASIVIHLAAARRVWIAMIESAQMSSTPFFIQPGHFHIQGLIVENRDETAYQDQVLPPLAPTNPFSIPPGQSAIAYIEGGERLITALHDPGIREQALSTGLDTSVRTQALGQVKSLLVANDQQGAPPTADTIRAAFANQRVPTSQLELGPAPTTSVTNPCDVTLEGGFTGRENHLYHFEVHSINPAAPHAVTFKVSREAGSELYSVVKFTRSVDGSVFIQSESGLRDGDLVEVLTDVVELGDASPAAIDRVPEDGWQLTRPTRLVGQLASLKLMSSEAGLDQFQLLDANDPNVVVNLPQELYPAYPDPPASPKWPLRLRRWHFLVRNVVPSPQKQQFPIENGLQISITGTTFEVGDWWQFESRLTENSGKPSLTRHGPERLFAPLALLVNDPTTPPGTTPRPEVSQWLDEPFVPISEISADTIHFDDTASRQVGFTDLSTLQAVLDQLLVFGPGKSILEQITHFYNQETVLLGRWQMTVGDGTLASDTISFGDFNGQDAIQQAVQFVRLNAGLQNPWSLTLFVKRGTYIITENTTIVLGPGECLRLVGEGSPLTASTGNQAPATIIQCTNTTNPAFSASGSGSRLILENLTAIGGTAAIPVYGPLAGRTAGEIHIAHCHLVNRSIALGAGTDSAPPLYSLNLHDSTLEASSVPPMLSVQFPPTGNVTCPRTLIERCRIVVPPNAGFAVVGTASAAVRWDGFTIKDSAITLGGSNNPITPDFNPGLLAVQTATLGGARASDNILSIGDIVFENCVVDAGSSTVSGLFLHLPSGNDPTGNNPAIDNTARVSRIDNVVIRGGRWTIRSDTMQNAAIYVGDRQLDPLNSGGSTNIDPHIATLTVEKAEMGWSSTSATLRYGTTMNAFHAFIFSATQVRVLNVSFFGLVTRPGQGELVVYGTDRAIIDGLSLENFRVAGGATSPPAGRIRLYCSGTGVIANNVRVTGAGNIAGTGAVRVGVGGAPSGTAGIVGRRAVLTNCRVSQNSGSAGYWKNDELDVELIDCSAIACLNGVQFTQTVVDTPTLIRIRGGAYTGNTQMGIMITQMSRNANVTVEGATITGNRGVGLQIVPGSPFDLEWGGRGPVVINNTISGNSLDAGSQNPQVVLGSAGVDTIGGVCLGNNCRGANQGVIQVQTVGTYFMRGLSVDGVAPWASALKSALPAADANALMALNAAIWSP